MARLRLPGNLWRNQAFMRLWIAQVLSGAGSEVSLVAIPLTAVLVLSATSSQMGLLQVAGSLPNVLFALFAGVWINRLPRRPVLIGADLGRALLLATIPVAALLGHLTFVHLVLVIFFTATLSLLFIIASVSILPSITKADELVEANGKLATSDSVLSISGPSLAGAMTQLLSAPLAIALDVVSYALSAFFLRGLVVAEAPDRTTTQAGNMWREIGAGIQALVHTPLLAALTLSASVGSFGGGMYNTVLVLFLARNLALAPATIGLIFSIRGIGSLVGALLAGRMAQAAGVGGAVIMSNLLWGVGGLVMSLAGVAGSALVFLGVGQALMGIGAPFTA